MIVVTASQILFPLPAITSHNAIRPTPTCFMKNGIKLIRPDTIATIAPAAAAPDAAKPVKPKENISIPAPTAATPIPNNAIAPDSAKIVPTNDFSMAADTPITIKAPPKANKLAHTSSILIEPRSFNTGASTANAADTTTNAAAPRNAPFIQFTAKDIIVNEPPSAMRPIAISLKDMLPMIFMAAPKIISADANPIIPTALRAMSLGSKRAAMIKTVKPPAKAVNPIAISLKDMLPMIFMAVPKIISADANPIIPTALRAMSLGSKRAAMIKTVKPPAKAVNPLPISSQDMPPMIFMAAANINTANDKVLIAFDVLLICLSGNIYVAVIKTVKPPAKAVNPLPISSQDRPLMIFMAAANIRRATDKLIIALATLFISPSSLPSIILVNADIAIINSANKVVIATKELVSFSESISDNTNREAAKIPIATAMVFRVRALIEPVNALRASLTPPNMSFILSRKPPASSNIPLADFINLAI